MAVYQSMQDLIGHTPLVRLTHLGFPEGVHVFAKLELWNPSGSVKDRTRPVYGQGCREKRPSEARWNHY